MKGSIFFDGKSSKPYPVDVYPKDRGLQIRSTDFSDGVNDFFLLDQISVQSITNADLVILKLTTNTPCPTLQWEGKEAIKFTNQFLQNKNKIKHAEFLITRMNPVKIILSGFLILVSFIFLYVKFISPFIGDQAVKILPRSIEERTGEIVFNNIKTFINEDSTKTVLINEFYKECGFQSEYKIDITYSDNQIVNAFAIPGGKIVVYDGLVQETQEWEELAALLGHELAHVNQRHSFKSIARSFSSYIIISVLTGDIAGTSSVILEQASNFNNLANSRKYEREADEVGMEYLKNSSINPNSMLKLFEHIDSFNSLGNEDNKDIFDKIESKMEYLSTHPLGQNRIKNLSRKISEDPDFQYQPIQFERAKEIWEELKGIKGDDESTD